MHGQVRELLTNYGKIDIMWFDFSYPGMECETWKATELVEMARSLQPDLIIDNRLEGSGEKSGTIMTKNPSVEGQVIVNASYSWAFDGGATPATSTARL